MTRPLRLTLIATSLFLGACCGKNEKVVPTEADIARAQAMKPQDPTLADLYNRSCTFCHTQPATGAPLTGHSAEWQRRLNQRGSAQELLNSAIHGYQSMPPLGACFDCSEDQLLRLIAFMSDLAVQQAPETTQTKKSPAP